MRRLLAAALLAAACLVPGVSASADGSQVAGAARAPIRLPKNTHKLPPYQKQYGSYSYVYSLPKLCGYSVDQAGRQLEDHLPRYFPIAGSSAPPIEGRIWDLRYLGGLQLGPIGDHARVVVYAVAANGFSLVSLPGHPEGAYRTINFQFIRHGSGLALKVSAWGPVSFGSLLGPANDAFTREIWRGFADNIDARFPRRSCHKTPAPKPKPKPNPKPTPIPPTTCAADNLAQPPSAGCYRVTVQIIPTAYPGDTQGGLGVGVGSATVQPSARTLTCLNPADAGACVMNVDVAANTTVSVSETPGSERLDPVSPPDSAFQRFGNACTGTGACTFTPSSNSSVVSVYFIPATATLTLDANPEAGPEMSAVGHGPVAGTDPFSPVYCGATQSVGLPCQMLVRVNGQVQVQANSAGDDQIDDTPIFSNNCVPETGTSNYCDVTVTSDQTVTASFGTVGLG